MKLFIKVKPNASKNSVEQSDATHYSISITAAPVQGKANAAVIDLLSSHLKLAKSLFVIKRGSNSKQKTIEVSETQKFL